MFVDTAVMLKITRQLINGISCYFFCWDSCNRNITRADERYDIHAGGGEGWGSVMWLYNCAKRPFPSSKNHHFKNKANWKTFLMKMSFLCTRINNHFNINGFAHSFALKKRLRATDLLSQYICRQTFIEDKKKGIGTHEPKIQMAGAYCGFLSMKYA